MGRETPRLNIQFLKKLVFTSIALLTGLGILAGFYGIEFLVIPFLSVLSLVWILASFRFGWWAVMAGLTAFLAAFAGIIDMPVFAAWWALLAGLFANAAVNTYYTRKQCNMRHT
jgi:4-hydroxybenzoate polyprenyltransferase